MGYNDNNMLMTGTGSGLAKQGAGVATSIIEQQAELDTHGENCENVGMYK